MPKDTLPKILGVHHYTLKKAYYGVLLKLINLIGRSIKSYDINSLYPSVMHDCEMPVGIPKYFLGDIREMYPNNLPFGFLRVKVTTPLDIKRPPTSTYKIYNT
jgi:hypothetical protein